MTQQPYQRPARIYPEPLPVNPIIIVSPPPMMKMPKGMAMWLPLLFPVVGSLGSFMFVFVIHSLLWGILVGIFAGLMVLTSVLMFWQQRRSVTVQRKESHEKYEAYLNQKELELSQIAGQQQSYYQTLYPNLVDHVDNAKLHKRVWERMRRDPDFLTVSIGRGKLPLCCPIQLDSASNPFVDVEQSLLASAKGLIAFHERVEDCPAVISLASLKSIAICSSEKSGTQFMRAILVQIGMFYTPSDVKVVVCCQPERTAAWRWLKWLPHARQAALSEQSMESGVTLTCLFDEMDEFKFFAERDVVPILKQWQHRDMEIETVERSFEPPHFVCLFDGVDSAVFFDAFSELFVNGAAKDRRSTGVTLIHTVDPNQTLPAWVTAQIDIDDSGNLRYEELQLGGRRIDQMRAETICLEDAEFIARKLAPLRIQAMGGIVSAAMTFSLLELLGRMEWTQDTIKNMWRSRGLDDTLRVPIGRKMDGRPLVIDLKESADGGMGPHGMIVGATGSGKSELLRTIVSSLALHHSPEVLNFVFVDFKGGAAFAELANLPHRAGVVTNLEREVALVDRVYDALYGEVERRQRLLREAGNLDNIKHYQDMQKTHKELQPMPYLLVIVDEFGELLASRPDFQELFVTIGRIGRSIGMHLLLATQRFDEGRAKGLESHLRYRICLRTFSAEESTAVLGNPQAFHLPPYPGIGYLKVDTNPLEAFKTASVSFPYESQSERSLPDNRVYCLSGTGTFVPVSGDREADSSVGSARTQTLQQSRHATEVTELKHVVAQLSEQPYKHAHQVWLPPLNSSLTLDQVAPFLGDYWLKPETLMKNSKFDPLCVPLGQVDVPREQRIDIFTHSFVGAGGHLAAVGAPQSGKSTFLTTLLAGFISTHKPTDVQFYVIDLGGGLLRKFEKAPHVGAVYGKAESQLIPGVIRHVRGVIEEREIRFRDFGIDNMVTYRSLRRQGQLPEEEYGDVFLVIDDFGQLWTDFESVEQDLVDIVASGLNYGVHVVLTANRWVDIRAKVRDNIGGRLELRLNDPADSEFGRSYQLGLAGGPPGRGVTRHGLYVQVARPLFAHPADNDGTSLENFEMLLQQVRLKWDGPSAPPVRELPLVLREEAFLTVDTGQKGFPIGVEATKLTHVLADFNSADPHMIVLGDAECGKTNFIRYVIHQLTRRYSPEEAQLLVIDYRRALLDDVIGLPHLKSYACTVSMVNDAVQTMVETLTDRVPSSLDLTSEGLLQQERWNGPHFYLFVDDYDWMASQGLSPLNPLVDLILQARDIGLHVILTRRLGGVNGAMYEAVFKRLREMGVPTLVMGGDAQEAKLLGCPNVSTLPPGRGYLQRRNTKSTLIHTPLCKDSARIEVQKGV